MLSVNISDIPLHSKLNYIMALSWAIFLNHNQATSVLNNYITSILPCLQKSRAWYMSLGEICTLLMTTYWGSVALKMSDCP